MGILNTGTLLAEIINFVVLLVLLKLFAFPALSKMLAERRRRIEGQIAAAEQDRQEALRLRKEFELQMAEARQEAKAILDRAEKTATAQAQELLEASRLEAKRIVEQAHRDLEAERAKAVDDVRRQIAELSVAVAGRLLGHALNEEHQHELVAGFIREVEGGVIQ